jgi:hypothetical protein
MTADTPNKPRVGIPWRTTEEESRQQMDKLLFYFDAVRRAGGEPISISLVLSPQELEKQLQTLDGFVLPGSPADVGYQPGSYGSGNPPAFRPGGETGLRNLLWLPNPECVFWWHAGSGCAVRKRGPHLPRKDGSRRRRAHGRSGTSGGSQSRKPAGKACRDYAGDDQFEPSPGDRPARQRACGYVPLRGWRNRRRGMDGRKQLDSRRAVASGTHAGGLLGAEAF